MGDKILVHQLFKQRDNDISLTLHQQMNRRQSRPHVSSIISEDASLSAIQCPTDALLTSTNINSSFQSGMNINAFNSINIRRLVQQSNHYWKAERTFFSSEKRHQVQNMELDKLSQSIQNMGLVEDDEGLKSENHIYQNSDSDTHRNQQEIFQLFDSDSKISNSIHQNQQKNVSTNYFSQNKKLQDIQFSFSLAKKGLNELSKFALQFTSTNLQIIDLSFNKFKDIPCEILSLTQLKVLKLDNNYIKELNPMLFIKLKLEHFSISNNFLLELPPIIGEWKSTLKYLDISLNRIEDLEAISQLEQLQSLHIHNNDFRLIPSSFNTLLCTQIQELSLDWFLYTQPPLELRQSGQQGSKVIQKMYLLLLNQYHNDIKYANFLEVVRHLSSKQFDIKKKDSKDHGRYLSHKAAAKEEIGCLISLLENDYSLINMIDDDGHTPLSLSIVQEKYLSSKALISNGANVNLGGGIFGNCLSIASIKIQYYLILDLLKRGADPNFQDNKGNAPLHYLFTIFHKDPSSVKICDLLLKFRADPNIKNKDDWAPIHLLSRKGTSEGMKFITDYNKYLAENNYFNDRQSDITMNLKIQNNMVNAPFKPFHINLRGGKEKQTSLHIACFNCQYNLVTLLLQNGADIFARDKQNKIPMHMCMKDNFLYKLLKLKEAQAFNKFFEQQQLGIGSQKSLPSETHQTPTKSFLTQNSSFLNSPHSSGFKATGNSPFFLNERKVLNNLKPSNSFVLAPTSSSSSTNAQHLSFKGNQNNTPSKRPSFTKHELKGVDSVESFEEFDDSCKINSSGKVLQSQQPQLLKDLLNNQDDEEDMYSSTITNKFVNATIIPQMHANSNHKNNSFQKEERQIQRRGQLNRYKHILTKQRFKLGEDQRESLEFEADPPYTEETEDKEEEFQNSEIDEAKSMLELFNTKQKIMNQQLAYAPNNIQQLNYIQSINRANLSNQSILSLKEKQAGHQRSKSEINSSNKLQQQPNNYLQKGLIKNDGADAPLQIITPQHISFFQYLLEKTKNMHEYYSVSLQNYKKGLLSEFNTLFEKFRFFVILLKLQIEFQNMILHLNGERKQLSSILGGEKSFLQINLVDQGKINIMVMKMLLEVVQNLKCERKQFFQIQEDFPSPQIENFKQSIPHQTNVAFWMRQYEDSFPELVNMNTQEEKFELVEGEGHPKEEQQRNEQQQEEINLSHRENRIIKESIIYQLGNYHFDEALEYLEKEGKSEESCTLNAFESFQSFFKIRENLICKESSLNSNRNRKQSSKNTIFKPLHQECDIDESLASTISQQSVRYPQFQVQSKHPSGNPTSSGYSSRQRSPANPNNDFRQYNKVGHHRKQSKQDCFEQNNLTQDNISLIRSSQLSDNSALKSLPTTKNDRKIFMDDIRKPNQEQSFQQNVQHCLQNQHQGYQQQQEQHKQQQQHYHQQQEYQQKQINYHEQNAYFGYQPQQQLPINNQQLQSRNKSVSDVLTEKCQNNSDLSQSAITQSPFQKRKASQQLTQPIFQKQESLRSNKTKSIEAEEQSFHLIIPSCISLESRYNNEANILDFQNKNEKQFYKPHNQINISQYKSSSNHNNKNNLPFSPYS